MRLLLVGAAAAVAVGVASAATSPIAFHRADGSRITFRSSPRVWCGRWERDVPTRAVQVVVLRTRRDQAYWSLSGVVKDVRPGKLLRFPVGFDYTRPRKAQLFVYDARTKNELSSEDEDSRGTVVFSKVGCKLGQTVELTVRGTIGSEFFDGKPITVSGRFRGVVGKPPPGF